ncbi:hypothetical protein D3C81_2194640 [compost metagenome]
MMSWGATTFFFDFDIFSMSPIVRAAPLDRRVATRWPSTVSMRTSDGSTQRGLPLGSRPS